MYIYICTYICDSFLGMGLPEAPSEQEAKAAKLAKEDTQVRVYNVYTFVCINKYATRCTYTYIIWIYSRKRSPRLVSWLWGMHWCICIYMYTILRVLRVYRYMYTQYWCAFIQWIYMHKRSPRLVRWRGGYAGPYVYVCVGLCAHKHTIYKRRPYICAYIYIRRIRRNICTWTGLRVCTWVSVYRNVLFIRGGHRRIHRYTCIYMGARMCVLVCVLVCVCS